MSYTRKEHPQSSGRGPVDCPPVPTVVDSPERYLVEIEQARRASRRLRIWAGASAIVGLLVTVSGLILLLTPREDPWEALNAVVFVGLAGVVGAIAMYASSWSVALAASRLELQLGR